MNVLQLAQLLWRRRTAIVLAGFIGACAAVAIGKTITPKYLASAQLYVDPRDLQLVDRELTPRSQDISGLAMVVESQARLITSSSVLLQVIQDARLDQDPEFGGSSRSGLVPLLGLFGIEGRPTGESRSGQTAALEALGRHISVKKTDRSFIVDIDVWSYDPAKAARLANAISNAYLAETRNSQSIAARRATSDLSGRLKELQERLRTAENELATYKAQNNFVGTQDTLISDQQLSASNQRLAAARAATLDAQAKYDQIESSRRASADGGAIPEALQSPTIANLRAQYAEARKRLAEMTSELGPLHPSLRQVEKQVEDLHRIVNEEIDRFAQSAKNDLTRARDFEASLNKALESQKRESLQMSQASVRLRELERDVEASRDVYRSFLKRSRETEEQESLNTSNARVIGEATVPQRRSFPPAMTLLAAIGFVFGGLAAASWFGTAELLSSDAAPAGDVSEPQADVKAGIQAAKPVETQSVSSAIGKPQIARLQESDVIRTLGGILASGSIPDLTRLGWPTLRLASPLTAFLTGMRDMREVLARRSAARTPAVMAVIGPQAGYDRSIATLNIALAAARDGIKVLIIDADKNQAFSNKLAGSPKRETKRLGWLSIGSKAFGVVETANGIAVLPSTGTSPAAEAIRKTIGQARSAGGFELVIIDGPALPWNADDRKLLDIADGLVAILPVTLEINGCMEEIIAGLGGAERKLIGVVVNELDSAESISQRSRLYA